MTRAPRGFRFYRAGFAVAAVANLVAAVAFGHWVSVIGATVYGVLAGFFWQRPVRVVSESHVELHELSVLNVTCVHCGNMSARETRAAVVDATELVVLGHVHSAVCQTCQHWDSELVLDL